MAFWIGAAIGMAFGVLLTCIMAVSKREAEPGPVKYWNGQNGPIGYNPIPPGQRAPEGPMSRFTKGE